MAKAQIKAQIYEEYKKRKDGKELKINKKQKIGIIGLAVMIAAFVAFRVFYQKGAKLLADMYPWNYVALVIIVGLLIWYFLWAKKHGDDDKKVESDADLTQKKPLLTSKQIGLAAAFGGAAFAFRALGIAIPMVPPRHGPRSSYALPGGHVRRPRCGNHSRYCNAVSLPERLP